MSLSQILNRSMVMSRPLNGSRFTLDTSGVAGVFGGEEAVSAMAGSYQIAKRYGLLAKSRFFDGFFPGVHMDAATLFDLDGWKGPKFRAAHSGTVMDETGHLAALFMKIAASMEGKVVAGRTTQPVGVTVTELKHVPPPQMYPRRISAYSPVFASIPIAVSVGTCVACAMFDDWFSFAMILLGILTSGISCLVIGSGNSHSRTPILPRDHRQVTVSSRRAQMSYC